MAASTSFTYNELIAELQRVLEEASAEYVADLPIIVSLGEGRLATDLNVEIFDRVVTGALTPDQYVQPIKPSGWQGTRSLHIQGLSGSGDPDYSDVVLLLNMDGVDGAQVADDASIFDHTLNFQNNAALITANKQFGTASYDADTLDPTDFIEIDDDAVFQFGTGDWTIEFWMNTADQVGGKDYINHADGGSGTNNWQVQNANSVLAFNYSTDGGSSLNVFRMFGSLAANGVWQHIAITRLGTDLFAHVDGVKSGSTFDVTGLTIGGGAIEINIGSRNQSGVTPNIGPAAADLDEMRITVGTARYTTANFTRPSAAFPSAATDGPRVYLERRTYEWCLDYEPDETLVAAPQYYAEYTETEFFLVPPPDLAYAFNLRQIQSPEALTVANQNTWLGDNAGDLLLYACLVSSEEFLKSDQGEIDVWKKTYGELTTARKLELRRQWRGDYSPVKEAARTVSLT